MIVGYVRISVKEASCNYSSSIINQMLLIKEYCRKYGFSLDKFYIDDGCSGINFDRKGFNKLKYDIEKGLISIVIVKDISRLGRETYESSYYITEYFKIHNVKFISIDENLDETMDYSTIINLKSFINDHYVKESSLKRKQVALDKINKHEFLGPYAPFGYCIKCIDGKRTLEISQNQASIVKRIFTLKASGIDCAIIAKIISLESAEENYKWNYKSVLRILRNRVYKGDFVIRKTEKLNYRDKRRKYIPYDNHTIIENVFPAIISKELFSLANSTIKTYKSHLSQKLEKEKYLVFCEKCNNKMSFYRRYKNEKYEYYFKCPSCGKVILESKLNVLVKDSINNLITNVDKSYVLNKTLLKINSCFRNKRDLLNEEKKLLRLRFTNIYLKKVRGEITLDEFNYLKKSINDKLSKSTCVDNEFRIDDLYDKFKNSLNLYKYVDRVVLGDVLYIYFKLKKE